MKRGVFIYILTNRSNQVLYVGVTSQLKNRIHEHKTKVHPNAFTARYNVDKLVYYEFHQTIKEAIYREKQLKAGSRRKKTDLIDSMNPNWTDLHEQVYVMD